MAETCIRLSLSVPFRKRTTDRWNLRNTSPPTTSVHSFLGLLRHCVKVPRLVDIATVACGAATLLATPPLVPACWTVSSSFHSHTVFTHTKLRVALLNTNSPPCNKQFPSALDSFSDKEMLPVRHELRRCFAYCFQGSSLLSREVLSCP